MPTNYPDPAEFWSDFFLKDLDTIWMLIILILLLYAVNKGINSVVKYKMW